jgi:hypothetical protein
MRATNAEGGDYDTRSALQFRGSGAFAVGTTTTGTQTRPAIAKACRLPRLGQLIDHAGTVTLGTPSYPGGEANKVTQGKEYLRASPRTPSRSKQLVRALSVGEEGQWLISVRDISLDGVGLATRRAFPIGSILALELPMRSGMVCRTARVKNLRASATKGWIVGCLFVVPLSVGDIVVQESSRQQPTRERRSKPRYSARYERGQCRVLSMIIEGPWLMMVHNVSETGIGLIADRPFKAGMMLSVELPGQPQATMSLRVVHSSKQPGNWLIGCAFPRRLSVQEVRALT